MEPRIQYAKTEDGVNIAYWTMGEGGTPLIICAPLAWSHISLELHQPELMAWYERLSRHRTIVRFDPRGFGLSQRELNDDEIASALGPMDIAAIAAHLNYPHMSIIATTSSSPAAVAFAADRPDIVEHLIVCAPAHGKDFTSNPKIRSVIALIKEDWGVFTETWAHIFLGWTKGSQRAHQWALFAQRSTSQENAARGFELASSFDFSPLLPPIKARTLVISDAGGLFDILATSQLIAAGVKDARLVQVDSFETAIYDNEVMTRAILEFLGDPMDESTVEADVKLPEGMTAILFLDIADSTALTTKLGDAAYRERERELDASLRVAIREAGGTPVEGKVLGDGVMAVFTSARQAIDAAVRCRDLGNEADLPLHLGIHAGDVVREGNNVHGGAVQLASRVQSLAAPGEILVSDIVRGLARTSAGVEFEDRGEHELKGISEPQRLFAVQAAEGVSKEKR